jgi:ATP-binding cassette, subfamily G (WHITE), member 2, PDR
MGNMTNEDGLLDPLEQWLNQEQRRKEYSSPHRQPRGVSFTEVDVNGYTEANSFQHTFASYIQLIPTYAKAIVGIRGPRQKVRILRDLDGLVRPGEMLLVLGRPGSGCTTFLKTMAGYVNGVEVVEKEAGGIYYEGAYLSFLS